ncbi:MAG: type IV pilus assembly protein PilP [Alphaproteobacteria bacterium]|jgi:type IV pilus assembly protein PilP
MKKLLVSLSAAVLLTGCGSNIDDLIVYTEKVRANTQVNIEPYPEFTPLPSVSYSANSMRSPFLRSRTEQIADTAIERPNCQQPSPNRRKQALESFGLDGLEMAGVFTNNGRKYALVKANDGSLHKVTRGSYIGLFNGRVTTIKNAEILIEEMLPDGAGCWKSKQATLTKSSMVGENNNV